MGSMYGSGSNAGSQLTQQQQQQAALIAQGQADVSAVFSGTTPTGPQVTGATSPTVQYYDQYGAPLPLGNPGSGGYSGPLYTGTTSTGGFDQAFYNKDAQAYENYAMPQEANQYQQASQGTAYSLANAGLLKSGAADFLNRSLQNQNTTAVQGIANTGIQNAQTLESNVNQEQNTILNQLQVSANPSLAASQATEAAAGFSAPSAFQPLGSLFSNWENTYLGSMYNQQYTDAASKTGQNTNYAAPLYNTSPSFGAPVGGSSSIS